MHRLISTHFGDPLSTPGRYKTFTHKFEHYILVSMQNSFRITLDEYMTVVFDVACATQMHMCLTDDKEANKKHEK